MLVPNLLFSRARTGRIEAFPTSVRKHKKNEFKEITLGDLHGNFLYLLHLLIYNGVVINCNSQTYDALSHIYHIDTNNLLVSDLIKFNKLISTLQFNTNIFIRLLGDEVADRGQNDYFTLKLFEKMHLSHLSFEIIFSNHGCEFIHGYETQTFVGRLLPEYVISTFNLRKIAENFNSTEFPLIEEMNRIIHEIYQPRLKVLSYTIDSNQDTLILYTHAPVGLKIIESLARELDVKFKDDTAQELIESINNINHSFQTIVRNMQVSKRINFDMIISQNVPLDAGLENIIWNRCIEGLDRVNQHPRNGMNIIWVHGHSYDCPTIEKKTYCLDTRRLGKYKDIQDEAHSALTTDWKSNKALKLFEISESSSDDNSPPLLSSICPKFNKLLLQFKMEMNELSLLDDKAIAINILHAEFSKLTWPCHPVQIMRIRMKFHEEIMTLTAINDGLFYRFFFGANETDSRKILSELLQAHLIPTEDEPISRPN